MPNWIAAALIATIPVTLPVTSLTAGSAAAQSVVSSGQSFVSGRLLPGAVEEGGTRLAGLRLELREGWKTYWRAPGEAGIPPRFDWSASKNIGHVEVLWPRPEVFISFGLQTIGYSGQFVLPLRITPVDPAKPIHLAVTADLGVCREICVFEKFSLEEAIDPDQRPIGHRQIRRAAATVPPPGSEAGLEAATCRISGAGAERSLEMTLRFGAALADPVVLIEAKGEIWINKITSKQVSPGALDVAARISLPSENTWITRKDLRMTVLAGNLAADIQGCTAPAG